MEIAKQTELKKKIIACHFLEQLAHSQKNKLLVYYYQGWLEALIKTLHGELPPHIVAQFTVVEIQIDMDAALKKFDEAVGEGKKLLL